MDNDQLPLEDDDTIKSDFFNPEDDLEPEDEDYTEGDDFIGEDEELLGFCWGLLASDSYRDFIKEQNNYNSNQLRLF